jgi:hypothetical protein
MFGSILSQGCGDGGDRTSLLKVYPRKWARPRALHGFRDDNDGNLYGIALAACVFRRLCDRHATPNGSILGHHDVVSHLCLSYGFVSMRGGGVV